MSPLLIPILIFSIPIVAIVAGVYHEVQKTKAKTALALGKATGHLDAELREAKAERDRLRERIEALEAIVTSESYDLEREARRAGLADGARRIDAGLLDAEAPGSAPAAGERRRVR